MIYEHQLFIHRLKRLRKQKKMSQDKLAQALNVSRGAVGHWESGNRTPDLGTIAEMSDLFNCNIAYILGFTDIKEKILSSPVFDMMFNSVIPMYIWIYDKNDMPRFIWVNKATLDVLGYKETEFLVLKPHEICEKISITSTKIQDEDMEIHVCKDGRKIPSIHVIHKINTPEQNYYLSINHYLQTNNT